MAGRHVPLTRVERSEARRVFADTVPGRIRRRSIHRLVAAGMSPSDIADARLREDPMPSRKGSTHAHVKAHNPTPQGRWTDDAQCTTTDPEVFMPPPEPPRTHPNRRAEWEQWVFEAKAVCNGDPERGTDPCPVRAKCLEWALANDEWGIWGATTEEERKALKRRARRAA